MATVKLELSEKEYKLLLGILKDEKETRQDMGCNDPYENEESLFTKKERKEMNTFLGTTKWSIPEDRNELKDFMFNSDYAAYLFYKLKEQK